jgi:hypothetical protein
VNCIPSYMLGTANNEEANRTVDPYLTHENKLYPVEVPADVTLDGLVDAISSIMGFPCMLRTDTRFPVRKDDRAIFV